jgi:3-oxoacyl-[acyl-carrier-protein] synthase-3
MRRFAAITGWGHYVPPTVLTNKAIESRVDTTDEWIRSRTGIVTRRIASPEETTSSMCAQAALRALERARLPAAELDLVICATTTPDQQIPATACLVHDKIGAVNAGAFDVNAACTGFLYGLMTGVQFIQAGTCRRVLVVAGEVLSRFVNWQDRTTCILHGDGSGAVILEATSHKCGVRGAVMGCKGDAGQMLTIAAGGSARPASAETVAGGAHFVSMRGNEIFKLAVRGMTQAATAALADARLRTSSIHKIIPHQANLRIIQATCGALGVAEGRVYINVDRYGNTGAAAVPLALSEYLDADTPEAGANLLLVAFGGGLTWASAVLRWADVEAVIREREQRRALLAVPAPLSAVS